MTDFLLLLFFGPVYLVAGPFVVRGTLAWSERFYLGRAEADNKPQVKMDWDDWIGASLCAGAAFMITPLMVMWWLVRRPLGKVYPPMRAFFLPPLQKGHEVHVDLLDTVKEQALDTARSIHEVSRDWQPDDEEKKRQLTLLTEGLVEQERRLVDLANPESPFDKTYMERTRMDIDRTRRGLRGKPQYKELTA